MHKQQRREWEVEWLKMQMSNRGEVGRQRVWVSVLLGKHCQVDAKDWAEKGLETRESTTAQHDRLVKGKRRKSLKPVERKDRKIRRETKLSLNWMISPDWSPPVFTSFPQCTSFCVMQAGVLFYPSTPLNLSLHSWIHVSFSSSMIHQSFASFGWRRRRSLWWHWKELIYPPIELVCRWLWSRIPRGKKRYLTKDSDGGFVFPPKSCSRWLCLNSVAIRQ